MSITLLYYLSTLYFRRHEAHERHLCTNLLTLHEQMLQAKSININSS